MEMSPSGAEYVRDDEAGFPAVFADLASEVFFALLDAAGYKPPEGKDVVFYISLQDLQDKPT